MARLEAKLVALEARLISAEAKKTADVDPEDLLDYVPYHEGRDLNPHAPRPQGTEDKPQLYRLRGLGYEVYDFLRTKKNAAYHELGTSACALSYFWDALHFFDAWAADFKKCGVEGAELAVDALGNSLHAIYGLYNRRKNLLELRTTCESESPSLQPTEYQKKLFDYMSRELDGFANNHGLDSSIDPFFKKILVKFDTDANAAMLKELSKGAGQAAAKPAKPKPHKPKGGGAAGGGGSSG